MKQTARQAIQEDTIHGFMAYVSRIYENGYPFLVEINVIGPGGAFLNKATEYLIGKIKERFPAIVDYNPEQTPDHFHYGLGTKYYLCDEATYGELVRYLDSLGWIEEDGGECRLWDECEGHEEEGLVEARKWAAMSKNEKDQHNADHGDEVHILPLHHDIRAETQSLYDLETIIDLQNAM